MSLDPSMMVRGGGIGLAASNYTPEQRKMLEEREAIERRREKDFAGRMAREKALELACGTYGRDCNPETVVKAAEAFRDFIEGPSHEET